MEPADSKQETDRENICPHCGAVCRQEEMVWPDFFEQPCCPQCSAEEESCGCSDE